MAIDHQLNVHVINSCITSIAALTGQTVGVMLSEERAKDIFLEIAREATRLSKAMGLKVPPYAKVLNYNLLMISDAAWFNKIAKLHSVSIGGGFSLFSCRCQHGFYIIFAKSVICSFAVCALMDKRESRTGCPVYS